MFKRLFAAAGVLIVVAVPLKSHAQVPVIEMRLGAHTAMPTADFANVYESGFGVYGRVGIPLGVAKLMGGATWNRFAPKVAADDDLDIFTVQAGPHFFLVPLVDLGLEAVYISDVEKFGLSPSVSVGFMKAEVTAAYYTTFNSPATSWLTLGVGLRF